MISISKYRLIRDEKNSDRYYVKSLEKSICPICGGPRLKVIGVRKRNIFNADGKKNQLVIRRLKCQGCKHIHHELPDILVPYKRYSTGSIEAIIDGRDSLVSCEESSINRMRQWFKEIKEYMAGCLDSIAAQRGIKKQTIQTTTLERIKSHTGEGPGWLRKVVRIMVNTNNWIHTRSAFMS